MQWWILSSKMLSSKSHFLGDNFLPGKLSSVDSLVGSFQIPNWKPAGHKLAKGSFHNKKRKNDQRYILCHQQTPRTVSFCEISDGVSMDSVLRFSAGRELSGKACCPFSSPNQATRLLSFWLFSARALWVSTFCTDSILPPPPHGLSH